MIRPVCSAIGTNSVGPTRPRRGCSQRASASTPITLPVASSALGWKKRTISPFWIAWRRPPASDSRRGLKRSRRGSNIAWPPPASLAEYMAMSARWISVSTPVPCAGWQAMPIEASTSSVRPSIENGSRRPARSWRATTLASPGRRSCGSSTPNSSPPRRATVSLSPSDCSRRRATSSSRRSPAWWPSVSLISLKWSRSISITAEATSARRPEAIACSILSRKSVRLGSPVSASCSDWCSLAIAARPPRWTARNGSSSSSSAGSENSAASTTTGERPSSRPAVEPWKIRSLAR